MNKKLLLITSAAIASASIYSFSGVAVAATDTATVKVVQALTITNATTALNFGEIVVAAAGTVVVAPDGTTGTSTIAPSGSPAAAEFTVTGEDGKAYSVSVPTTSVTLAPLVGIGPDMTATAFHYDAGSGVDTDGSAVSTGATLSVGATLNVGASQTSGIYTGSYAVTVNYN